MISNNDLKQLLTELIRKEAEREKKTSGSDHLSHVSQALQGFESEWLEEDRLKLVFSYSKIIETEFTSYPDNPPKKYLYQKEIHLNYKMELIYHSDARLISNDLNFDENLYFNDPNP